MCGGGLTARIGKLVTLAAVNEHAMRRPAIVFICFVVAGSLLLLAVGSSGQALGCWLGPLYLLVAAGNTWKDVVASCVMTALLVVTGVWAINRPTVLSCAAAVVAVIVWFVLGSFFVRQFAL